MERLQPDPRVIPYGQVCGRAGKTLGSTWRRSTSSVRVFSTSVSFGSIAIFKLQRAILTSKHHSWSGSRCPVAPYGPLVIIRNFPPAKLFRKSRLQTWYLQIGHFLSTLWDNGSSHSTEDNSAKFQSSGEVSYVKFIVWQFARQQYTLLTRPLHLNLRYRAYKIGFYFCETEFALNYCYFLRCYASPINLFSSDLKSFNYPRKAETLRMMASLLAH